MNCDTCRLFAYITDPSSNVNMAEYLVIDFFQLLQYIFGGRFASIRHI